jgi:hypothetical protein
MRKKLYFLAKILVNPIFSSNFARNTILKTKTTL